MWQFTAYLCCYSAHFPTVIGTLTNPMTILLWQTRFWCKSKFPREDKLTIYIYRWRFDGDYHRHPHELLHWILSIVSLKEREKKLQTSDAA